MTEIPNPTMTVTEFKVLDEGMGLPITYKIDQVIPILDGRVKFLVKEFNVVFDVRVKQVKGRGAYYADDIKKPSEGHLAIIRAWISPAYCNRTDMTINAVYFMMRKEKRKSGMFEEIKPAPIQGRISELVRKGVLTHVDTFYLLNNNYAQKVLKELKF